MNERGPFTEAEALAAWNEGAAAWDEFVESGADWDRHAVHGPALLAACLPVAGLQVLDLGCGQGYFSRELARCGAGVTGVDFSAALIAYGRDYEARRPLGIDYRAMSAAGMERCWPAASFDLVTACLSLQDMADVAGTLRGAGEVLRPGGRMVFSVPHPGTDTPFRQWELDEQGHRYALMIDRYFESGSAVCRWRMARMRYQWETPYWRYTLTEWSALIAGAGFLIRRLHEPRPTPEQVERNPNLEDTYRLPHFLIFDLVKA